MAEKQEIEDFKTAVEALDALNELAQSLWEQDEPERACLCEAQIFESSSRLLGKTHEATLNAMHNYALGLAKTGRDEEAGYVLEEYLDIIARKEAEKSEHNAL